MRLSSAVLVFVLLWISPLHANYLNPSEFSDCNLKKIPLWDAAFIQADKGNACYKTNPGSANRNHSNWIGAVNTSCDMSHSRQCAQYYQEYCRLKERAYALQKQCRAKLTKTRLEAKELKDRQEAFERAQRERERRENQQNALQNSEPTDPQAKFVRDAFFYGNPFHEGLTKDDIPTGLLIGQTGRYLAIRGGVPPRPLAGSAGSLSAQLRIIGNQFVKGAHRAALEDLTSAMAAFDETLDVSSNSGFAERPYYNSDNPRPTDSQLEEAFASNEELQEHIERVADAALRLPLGDQSAVNSAAGELLTEIVKARASGDISSLTNALSEYVSAVRREALSEYEVVRPQTSSEADLRRDRLQTLRQVEETLAIVSVPTSEGSEAGNDNRQLENSNVYDRCIEYLGELYRGQVHYLNKCTFVVECIREGDDRDTSRNAFFFPNEEYVGFINDTGYVKSCWVFKG